MQQERGRLASEPAAAGPWTFREGDIGIMAPKLSPSSPLRGKLAGRCNTLVLLDLDWNHLPGTILLMTKAMSCWNSSWTSQEDPGTSTFEGLIEEARQ